LALKLRKIPASINLEESEGAKFVIGSLVSDGKGLYQKTS